MAQGFVRCKVLSFCCLCEPHTVHAAQGMELHRHTQWLVRGHQGTMPAFSPMASRSQGPRQGESQLQHLEHHRRHLRRPSRTLGASKQLCKLQGRSSARSALEEALKTWKKHRMCGEARGGVETLGRGKLKCVQLGAPQSVPPMHLSSEKTSSQGRGARPRSQRSPGSDGGEVGKWVAQFGGPQQGVARRPIERRKQEHWPGVAQIFAHSQGGHSAQNPSEVMSTLIDRGVQRHQGSIGE